MLTSYPARSQEELPHDLYPILPDSTEAWAWDTSAEVTERVGPLGVSYDVRQLLEGLTLIVRDHHPWPCGASAEGHLNAAAAGCGVTDSLSVNGQLMENVPAAGVGGDPDADAGLVLPPLPPSGIDPALQQPVQFVKAFRIPNGWEPDLPDIGQTLDDLRRRVLDEIMEFLHVTRAKQIIHEIYRMVEGQESEMIDAPELVEELCQIMHSNGCAPGIAHTVLWELRSDPDPLIRAAAESFFRVVYLIRFPEEQGQAFLRPFPELCEEAEHAAESGDPAGSSKEV